MLFCLNSVAFPATPPLRLAAAVKRLLEIASAHCAILRASVARRTSMLCIEEVPVLPLPPCCWCCCRRREKLLMLLLLDGISLLPPRGWFGPGEEGERRDDKLLSLLLTLTLLSWSDKDCVLPLPDIRWYRRLDLEATLFDQVDGEPLLDFSRTRLSLLSFH